MCIIILNVPPFPFIKRIYFVMFSDKKKVNKMKAGKDVPSDADSRETRRKGKHKKSSKERRRKKRRRYYTSESESSSDTETESSDYDSDSDSDSSSSSLSSSSDDRRRRRKKSSKRDKHRRGKRKRDRRRDKRRRRRDKRSKRKSKRLLYSLYLLSDFSVYLLHTISLSFSQRDRLFVLIYVSHAEVRCENGVIGALLGTKFS